MDDIKAGLINQIKRAGGVENLPEISGPRLEQFHPRELAKALKSEVLRARQEGWPKISLHMDIEDALALARALEVR